MYKKFSPAADQTGASSPRYRQYNPPVTQWGPNRPPSQSPSPRNEYSPTDFIPLCSTPRHSSSPRREAWHGAPPYSPRNEDNASDFVPLYSPHQSPAHDMWQGSQYMSQQCRPLSNRGDFSNGRGRRFYNNNKSFGKQYKQHKFSGEQQSNISDYYHPSMLQNPWQDLAASPVKGDSLCDTSNIIYS